MSRTLKTHPFKGLRLTADGLKARPECLSELTPDHIRVRLSQGMAAERAITLPLKNRTQRDEAAALKIESAQNLERSRIARIMRRAVKETSTHAYYAIGASEARKQLQLKNA